MTKKSMPFDGTPVTNAADWSAMARHFLADGVLTDIYNKLATYADSTGMQIKIPSGAAWVKGHYYQNDAQETLAITAAHATLARIDRVVLRVDWTNGLINTAILTGTPAASPAEPALTQSGTIWEFPLASIAVGAAVSTITAANVTDERVFAENTQLDDQQTNNSGVALVANTIVAIDTTVTSAFKQPSANDNTIIGLLTKPVSIAGSTRLVTQGKYPVWAEATTHAIANGDWLIPSPITSGYVTSSGSKQRPANGIAVARQALASGTAIIEANFDIQLNLTTPGLQLLATRSTGSTSSGGHTIDAGTNLIVIRGANSSTTLPTTISIGSQVFTIKCSENSSKASYIAILENPTATGSVTITGLTGTWEVENYYSPFVTTTAGNSIRDAKSGTASGTSLTVSGAVSVAGDLVLDAAETNAGTLSNIVPNSGQTVDYQPDTGHAYSRKTATGATSSMGWSGWTSGVASLSIIVLKAS